MLDFVGILKEDNSWLGIHSGEGGLYWEHIRTAILFAVSKPNSLLLFTGGVTRDAAVPISEAASYYILAERQGWDGHPEIKARTAVEDRALDSAGNLVNSFHRFFEITGKIPKQITVCNSAFKMDRFGINFIGFIEDMLAKIQEEPQQITFKYAAQTYAAGSANNLKAQLREGAVCESQIDVCLKNDAMADTTPLITFRYLGVNNPLGDRNDISTPLGRAVFEEKKIVSLLEKDKLGMHTKELVDKAAARNQLKFGGVDSYSYLERSLVAAFRSRCEEVMTERSRAAKIKA